MLNTQHSGLGVPRDSSVLAMETENIQPGIAVWCSRIIHRKIIVKGLGFCLSKLNYLTKPCSLICRSISMVLPSYTTNENKIVTDTSLTIPDTVQTSLAQTIAQEICGTCEELKVKENEDIEQAVPSQPKEIKPCKRWGIFLYRFFYIASEPIVDILATRLWATGKFELNNTDTEAYINSSRQYYPQIQERALQLRSEGINRATALSIATREYFEVSRKKLEIAVISRKESQCNVRLNWAMAATVATTIIGCVKDCIVHLSTNLKSPPSNQDVHGYLKIYIRNHASIELIRKGEKTGRTVGKYPRYRYCMASSTLAKQSQEINQCHIPRSENDREKTNGGGRYMANEMGNKTLSQSQNLVIGGMFGGKFGLKANEKCNQAIIMSVGKNKVTGAASAVPKSGVATSAAGTGIAYSAILYSAKDFLWTDAKLVDDRQCYRLSSLPIDIESEPSVSFSLDKHEYQRVNTFLDEEIESCRLGGSSCKYKMFSENCVDFAQSVFSQTNYKGHFHNYMKENGSDGVAVMYATATHINGHASTIFRGSSVLLGICLGRKLLDWGSTIYRRVWRDKKVKKVPASKKIFPGRIDAMRKKAKETSKQLNGYLENCWGRWKKCKVINSHKVVDGDYHLDRAQYLGKSEKGTEKEAEELRQSLKNYREARLKREPATGNPRM